MKVIFFNLGITSLEKKNKEKALWSLDFLAFSELQK